MNNRLKGAYYEERAAVFLKSLGFDILSRNYRTPAGEIDIIASRNGIISFIEVKYRATDAFGMPSEAVDRKKQMRIIRASEFYLSGCGMYSAERSYDVVEILGGRIRLIENCFGGY